MTIYETLRDELEREQPITLITVLDAPEASGAALGYKLLVWPDGRHQGSLGNLALDRLATELAHDPAIATGCHRVALEAGDAESLAELFVEVFAPPPTLVIVGAVHVAIHLAHFAKRLGFRALVLDARAAFATAVRFPHADELILRWPAEALSEMPIGDGTYCVFLTHDPKLDDPAMAVALERGARYVGALGSNRTHAKRVKALRERGLTEDQIARIHAPIGLDLGGRRPEEIALAIAAELVQARYRPGPASGGSR